MKKSLKLVFIEPLIILLLISFIFTFSSCKKNDITKMVEITDSEKFNLVAATVNEINKNSTLPFDLLISYEEIREYFNYEQKDFGDNIQYQKYLPNGNLEYELMFTYYIEDNINLLGLCIYENIHDFNICGIKIGCSENKAIKNLETLGFVFYDYNEKSFNSLIYSIIYTYTKNYVSVHIEINQTTNFVESIGVSINTNFSDRGDDLK